MGFSTMFGTGKKANRDFGLPRNSRNNFLRLFEYKYEYCMISI